MTIDYTLLKQITDQQPYPLLFATISGAHLYGFPSPDSDFDLRGVHILPNRELLGLYAKRETIEIEEIRNGLELDLVTHDVAKFFNLVLKRNGYVLEQIFSPLIIESTPEHDELKAIALHCVTQHHAHHYLGFARTQWGFFTKTNRVKPLLYVLRVLLTGIHLMQTGEVQANLVQLNEKFQLSYINDLVEQKVTGTEKGTLKNADVDFYQREYDRLVNELESARDASYLPDVPQGKDALNDLLLRLRGV